MRFAGTRNTYSKEKVRELRQKRRMLKPKKDGLSAETYNRVIGDLQAAGHLQINGIKSMVVDRERVSPNGITSKGTYSLAFDCFSEDGYGERAHLQGYLQSASNADKQIYRIKGWFNEDGTIRIELVN